MTGRGFLQPYGNGSEDGSCRLEDRRLLVIRNTASDLKLVIGSRWAPTAQCENQKGGHFFAVCKASAATESSQSPLSFSPLLFIPDTFNDTFLIFGGRFLLEMRQMFWTLSGK